MGWGTVDEKAADRGLYLYDHWDWDKKYPVVRFDFSIVLTDSIERLEESLNSLLNDNAEKYQISFKENLPSLRLKELIQKLMV
ncbi:AAA family ATPase [Calditerrivibrio sp.]|uniref:AAA family ATPase n=1 Tax=Calditerrivibrio sp. TaxID=2792612 RepID=UPI003D0B74DF